MWKVLITIAIAGLVPQPTFGAWRTRVCVPEDPTAVAVRKEQEKQMEWKYALFGTGLFLIVGGLAAFQFLRDTKQALAVKNRPRQPWEDPELIAQATSFTSNINSQQTHRSRPGG